MADKLEGGFEREVRDTIVKSSLTGVAATVLAVTVFSPAGFGGIVGTSLASGFGGDSNTAPADNPYANLPAYPAPLTVEEVSDIRGQIASTTAAMEITRAATETRIERVRAIAMADGLVSFSSMSAPLAAPALPQIEMPAPVVPQIAEAPAELRLSLSEPAAVLAPVEAPVEMTATPVSYAVGGAQDYSVPPQDTHLEFADLLFAHEEL